MCQYWTRYPNECEAGIIEDSGFLGFKSFCLMENVNRAADKRYNQCCV